MGKSTISTGPFSIAFCMFTRGYPYLKNPSKSVSLRGQPLNIDRRSSAVAGSAELIGHRQYRARPAEGIDHRVQSWRATTAVLAWPKMESTDSKVMEGHW